MITMVMVMPMLASWFMLDLAKQRVQQPKPFGLLNGICRHDAEQSGNSGNFVTRNNTKIDKFAVFCELYGSSDSGTSLDGIGTFCHEFSHCLGLPDFYPTDYSNHFGMGSWSVMHGGCDNNNGNRPCSYTAYERNFLGWMNLSTPTEGETYTIPTRHSRLQATTPMSIM